MKPEEKLSFELFESLLGQSWQNASTYQVNEKLCKRIVTINFGLTHSSILTKFHSVRSLVFFNHNHIFAVLKLVSSVLLWARVLYLELFFPFLKISSQTVSFSAFLSKKELTSSSCSSEISS